MGKSVEEWELLTSILFEEICEADSGCSSGEHQSSTVDDNLWEDEETTVCPLLFFPSRIECLSST